MARLSALLNEDRRKKGTDSTPCLLAGQRAYGASMFLGKTAPGRAFRIRRNTMHGIIYLVGLIVVVMAILSFLGL